jgi:hypothetical protein
MPTSVAVSIVALAGVIVPDTLISPIFPWANAEDDNTRRKEEKKSIK